MTVGHPERGASPWIVLAVIAALAVILVVLAVSFQPPQADPFLGPTAFSGTFDAGPSTAPVYGGKSTYDGAVVFTNLERAVVAAALPSGLALAPNVSGTPNRHPVIFIISHHANMSFIVPGPDPPYPPEYEELILLIPFVRHQTGSKWHTLVERMYLGDPAAIALGNFYFGYRKELGSFLRVDTDLAPTSFDASHLGIPYFEARLTLDGPWRTNAAAETSLAHYEEIQQIFEMPLVGRFAGAAPWLPYICSYWQWDTSAAMVRPMKSQHRMLQAFSPGTSSWVALGSLSSVDDGAVALRGMEFRIGLPGLACQF